MRALFYINTSKLCQVLFFAIWGGAGVGGTNRLLRIKTTYNDPYDSSIAQDCGDNNHRKSKCPEVINILLPSYPIPFNSNRPVNSLITLWDENIQSTIKLHSKTPTVSVDFYVPFGT